MILALLGIVIMFIGALRDDNTPPWDESGGHVFLVGLLIMLLGLFITTAK